VCSGALAHKRVSSKHDKIELVRDHRLASIQLSYDMGDTYSILLAETAGSPETSIKILPDYTVSHPIRLLLTSAVQSTEIQKYGNSAIS